MDATGSSPTEPPGGPTTLQTVDIVVLVIYFLLILAVGFWVRTSRFGNTARTVGSKNVKCCKFFSNLTRLVAPRSANVAQPLVSTRQRGKADFFLMVYVAVVAV